jgi:hypothetical protein
MCGLFHARSASKTDTFLLHWPGTCFTGWARLGKKRASKLFDGEEVEPLRLKMRMKRMASLIGVQVTRHPRNGWDT